MRKRNTQPPLSPEEVALRLARMRKGHQAYYERKRLGLDKPPVDDPLLGPLPHAPGLIRGREWTVIEAWLTGHSLGEIRQRAGYGNDRAVWEVLQRPHVKGFIDAVRTTQLRRMAEGAYGAHAVLRQAQVAAAQKVATLVTDAQSEKLQLEAATHVLDRTGLPKSAEIHHTHTHQILREFSPEEMHNFAEHGTVPPRFAPVFEALQLTDDPDAPPR